MRGACHQELGSPTSGVGVMMAADHEAQQNGIISIPAGKRGVDHPNRASIVMTKGS